MNQILSFLESAQANFLADQAALVNLDCGTHNKDGVDQVGQWVNQRGQSWDWQVERLPVTNYGDCWLARLRGQGAGRVMLMGHLDTVYPDGTAAARPMQSQIVISRWGGSRRAKPYAFTQQGIAMLSSVLNSKRAIQVNIQIMRVFTRLRQILLSNKDIRRELEELKRFTDDRFRIVFTTLDQL